MEFRRSPNSFEDSYSFINSVVRRSELAVSRRSLFTWTGGKKHGAFRVESTQGCMKMAFTRVLMKQKVSELMGFMGNGEVGARRGRSEGAEDGVFQYSQAL